jgi:hypothetical protein
MAPGKVVLGKRKRRVPTDRAANVDAKSDKSATLEEAQAIFRKHFEAQFAPLEGCDDEAGRPAAKTRSKGACGRGEDDGAPAENMRSETSDSGDGDDGQYEWAGLSTDDDDDDDGGGGDSKGGLVPGGYGRAAEKSTFRTDHVPVTDGEGNDDDASEGVETDPESGSETEQTNNHQVTVEVVDHSKPPPSLSTLTPQAALMTKREMRAYLSSRPPDAVSSVAPSGKARSKQQRQRQRQGDDDPQDEDSRSLLANDLELQRLLSESHILSGTNPFNRAASGPTAPSRAFSEGRTRALTTDLRLQKLGSTGSIFNNQKKMPMAMRKGILGARAAREDKRRREAKENGIILEKETRGEGGAGKGKPNKTKRKARASDLPVDMPGMGTMKGGELRLSRREVRAVETEGRRMGDYRAKGKHKRPRSREA